MGAVKVELKKIQSRLLHAEPSKNVFFILNETLKYIALKI